MLLGDIVLSEIIIHKAHYKHSKLNIIDEMFTSGYKKFSELNYEISSLLIDTLIIIYEDELFNFITSELMD